MSYTALLVSEQRFKQWTPVDSNMKVDDITPYILNAQDVYIQGTLGTKFYTRLKEGIINSDLTADETNILNTYIAPTLMNYALYLMLPFIKYKIVDKGILSGTSEETASTSLDELQYLRQITLDLAEFYDTRLKEFLCDNPGMFSQYTNYGTDGMAPDHTSSYFSGLVIPNKKSNKTWYDGPAQEQGI